MGYFNPILQYGIEKFCSNCKDVGIDGLIIPDLPADIFKKNYKIIFEKYKLNMMFLITPQTSNERIKLIDDLSFTSKPTICILHVHLYLLSTPIHRQRVFT